MALYCNVVGGGILEPEIFYVSVQSNKYAKTILQFCACCGLNSGSQVELLAFYLSVLYFLSLDYY